MLNCGVFKKGIVLLNKPCLGAKHHSDGKLQYIFAKRVGVLTAPWVSQRGWVPMLLSAEL